MAKRPSKIDGSSSRRRDSRLEMSEDDKIVTEAQDRLQTWDDWESDFVKQYRDDVKFNNGDSDNGWQWPENLRNERVAGASKRPTLTINKTAQKVNLIVNDGRQNKPSVTIKPIGEDSSFRSAQIWEGIVRHIEYISKAQAIYDVAYESAVEGGIGYWRVNTKYMEDDPAAGADVFSQDMVIEPVVNQMGVALDLNIKQKDGSDAKWAVIFDDIPRDEAETDWPDVDYTTEGLKGNPALWMRPDTVRVAEYYRIKEIDDELIYMEDENQHAATFYRSEVPEKYRKRIEEAEQRGDVVKRRDVKRKKLEWYKIVGNTIVARNLKLRGKYVPVVRVIGIERVIDGKLYRRGHVRMLKDPQRMYNYNSSGQVESGALATKTKWVGQKEAFSGNEKQWDNANLNNAPYLTVNGWDYDHEREIPMPQQVQPAQSVPVFLDGMKIAEHEIDMASGQFEAQDGRQGNERSGKAIAERQRQGDTSTYHFIDHLALAIRYTGMIILDSAPYVYDTERVLQILGKDGTESLITIKPDQDKAVEENKKTKQDREIIEVMFNPRKGKYSVESDIGPAYSTQRQEAWNAFVQIVTGAPDLINEIGDFMFRSADFPLANEIADRLRKKIKAEKPYLFDDDAPTPAMQAAQQQIKELTQQVGELIQQLAEKRLRLIGKEQMRDIDAFDANTKRLTAETNAVVDLKGSPEDQDLHAAIRKVLSEMVNGQPITGKVDEADDPSLRGNGQQDEQPPVEGAQRADDGNWYVQHPETGQYLRVDARQ